MAGARTSPGRTVARALAALTLGAGLHGLTNVGLPPACEPTEAGRVAVWACDRDAQVVEGLDWDLYRVIRVDVSWPLAVAARPDGGVWVVSAALPNPRAVQRLLRLGADGGLAATVAIGVHRDMAVTDSGEALVVEARLGAARVALFSAGGRLRAERQVQAASRVATRSGRVLVGTSDGQVLWTDARLSVLRRRALEAAILDVEPAADGWFVLEDIGFGRVSRLNDDLDTQWAMDMDRPTDHLSVGPPGATAVWAVGSGARLYAEDGGVAIEHVEFPMRGVQASVAGRNGGLLAAAPGAVLRLDRHGRVAPGQGGFDFLVDLSAVRTGNCEAPATRP